MAEARRHAAAAGGGSVRPQDRPATAGMAPAEGGRADLRAGGAGCVRLAIRSHRRRPRERDRPRSLDGGHCAREARRCRHDPSRYRLAWGSAPAGPTARPWPPSRPTPNRPTGEPASLLPSGCGPPARRPCARPSAAISAHSRLQPTPVLSRGPEPGAEIPPDGNRHRAEIQPTQLKVVSRRSHPSPVRAFAITRGCCTTSVKNALRRLACGLAYAQTDPVGVIRGDLSAVGRGRVPYVVWDAVGRNRRGPDRDEAV
jgi:hypothetical protein